MTQFELIKNALSSFTDESISFALIIDSSIKGNLETPNTIGIYVKSITDSDEAIDLIKDLETHFEKNLQSDRIKIVVLNDASPVIKFNVIEKNIILLMRDQHEYDEFYVRSLSEYFDWQEFIKHHYPEGTPEFPVDE
jgi:hypothetical protein